MAIVGCIMLVMIRVLSNAAVEYDIKQDLTRHLNENARYVTIKNKEPVLEEDFLFQDAYVYFVILDRKGEILYGEYPKELKADMNKLRAINNLNRSLIVQGEKYYVRDFRLGHSREGTHGIFLRGFIKKSDADSSYRTIEMVSYLSILGVFAAVLIVELLLVKKISKELKGMCKTAESIGSNMDMSQRMEYQNSFREISVLAQANNRMLDKMEQTFQLQEQFTSDVAHELRTPVTVVMAQCQYAKEHVGSKEEMEEVLDVIQRQSKKISAIITQLLNFSRLDQNRVELQEELVDLVEIVESICDSQQEKTGDDVTIEMHLEEAVTTGDINLIAIVIQNLITNAIKFSLAKGKIEIRTGVDGDRVFAEVQDYGIGIEKKDQEFIFQRFYKCDKSRHVEGFGLGLSLSQKIAQKHGGEITVFSEIGKGSRFTLYLPKR